MVYDGLKSTFDRDGYAVINNFLTEKEVEELKCAGEKLTENACTDPKHVFSNVNKKGNDYFIDSAEKISYFYEKGALDDNGELLIDASMALNKVGHALHRLHSVFEACTYSDKVADVCRTLDLVNPVVPQSMYIYKNPGIGDEVEEHQDSTYLFTTPDSLVGFWIALDNATLENGCLWMIPGSHKSEVYKRLVRNPDENNAADNPMILKEMFPKCELSSYVPVVVEKASLVLIHGRVLHKSHHNKSQYSRHAYTFHVFDKGVSQFSEQNWIQTKIGFRPIYV